MIMTYLISTLAVAATCSLVVVMSGGSLLSAVAMYFVSGQLMFIALIALAAIRHNRSFGVS